MLNDPAALVTETAQRKKDKWTSLSSSCLKHQRSHDPAPDGRKVVKISYLRGLHYFEGGSGGPGQRGRRRVAAPRSSVHNNVVHNYTVSKNGHRMVTCNEPH
jgi:hypothetical protein